MKIPRSFYYIQKSNVETGSPKPALKISKVGPLQTTAGMLMGKAKFFLSFDFFPPSSLNVREYGKYAGSHWEVHVFRISIPMKNVMALYSIYSIYLLYRNAAYWFTQ